MTALRRRVILGAVAPAVLVARITTPVLRLLEGYWPTWARGVRGTRIAAQQKKRAADEEKELGWFTTLEFAAVWASGGVAIARAGASID